MRKLFLLASISALAFGCSVGDSNGPPEPAMHEGEHYCLVIGSSETEVILDEDVAPDQQTAWVIYPDGHLGLAKIVYLVDERACFPGGEQWKP